MIQLGDCFIGNFPQTQGFGENPDIYKPLGFAGHEGVDFGCPTGTAIISATDGVISRDLDDPKAGGYGDYVVVWDQIQNCSTWYGHLRENFVSVGQKVIKGQLLGYSDNTGNSTGPHLHFGLRKCDASGNPINTDNGYKGFINANDKRIVTWVITNPTKPTEPPAVIVPTPGDTGDESRALAIVKTFKDHDPDLKDGNYEGAANALVGAYQDLGAAQTTIGTLTSFRAGVAKQLNIDGEIDTSKIATALSEHIKESDENSKQAAAGLRLFEAMKSWVNGKTWIWPEQTDDLIQSFLDKIAIPLPAPNPDELNGVQLIVLGLSKLFKGR